MGLTHLLTTIKILSGGLAVHRENLDEGPALCIIASITPTFSAMWWWRLAALLGAVLIVVGIVPFYIDLAAHGSFNFIQDHDATFGWIGITGTILAFTGCIGWTRFIRMQRRQRSKSVN